MVNTRRRTAASLCCCFAATAVTAHGRDNLPAANVLAMHHAISTASPLKRSITQREKDLLSRRLGALHSKGHAKSNSSEDEDIAPKSAVVEQEQVEKEKVEEEEAPMQFVMLGGSATTSSSSTSNNNKEEPATDLTPYTRIGGSSSFLAQTDRYPYMASLQLEGSSPSGKYDYHMCGGFLIAPDLIMTSAHCAEYSPQGSDEKFQAFNGVEIGRTNLGLEVEYDPMDLHTYHLDYENLVPEKLIKHPRYDEKTYEHDLMIVKVFGRSRYDPVKLDLGAVGGGQEITVMGWGAASANGNKKYSDELREADMLVLDNEACKNTQVDVTNPSTGATTTTTLKDNISSDMMCAMARNRFICHGDGGGPAIRRGANPQDDTVVGIVSWGYGCVDANYPAVMTRISDHEQWIRTIVCKESTDPPSQYGCPGGMTLNSASTARQTVTLKMKLDMMAVETGFVILTSPQPSVVAQRVPGYYKIKENELVEEKMDLPSNQCYKLIMLDSFGDGFCCDMGGGSGTLYLGTDTGYYTGRVLVEVDGKFDYDSTGEFCLDASSSVIGSDEGKSAVINSSKGSGSSSGSLSISSGSSGSNGNSNSGSGSNNASSGSNNSSNNGGSMNTSGGSGWSGPATSPAFEYCNKFCIDNVKALNCGSYTCYHSGASSTDSQASGNGGSGKDKDDFDPHGHASNPDEYYLTVQFKFDDHPQDVSWVLYDLTANEVRMFVDFDVYKEKDFANEKLEVVVNVDGPEAGEKQYAFTVYDKESNGLCCENGRGWYKLFLGDAEDDMKLLGDAKYEFSSSYYFTLFEEEVGNMTASSSSLEDTEEEITDSPTKQPTSKPTQKPTPSPTQRPSVPPTRSPSHSPTTPKPTFPWELKRTELMEEIGARWNTASVTPPGGKFNDVGTQDPRNFDFSAEMQRSRGENRFRIGLGLSALSLLCAFVLL